MSYLQASWRRWLAWLAVAIVFAIACVFLSDWQFDRRAQVVAKNDLIAANYDKPAVSPEGLLPSGEFDPALEWRPVSLRGEYLAGSELLVRNRPYGGNQGFLQVAVFVSNDGHSYLVDRGWLPTGSSNLLPDQIPNLPTGEIGLTARVRAAETSSNKDDSPGLLAAVSPAALALQVPAANGLRTQYYLRLASETPVGSDMPMLEPRPQLSEGNHLSYAIQWLIFAMLAFVTLGVFIRQERNHYRAANEPGFVMPVKRASRADRDNAAEDA